MNPLDCDADGTLQGEMTDAEWHNRAITISVHRDGLTKRLQLSVGSGDNGGYRIAGPKFSGSSELLMSRELSKRDIDEIRRYLDEGEAHLAARASAPSNGAEQEGREGKDNG